MQYPPDLYSQLVPVNPYLSEGSLIKCVIPTDYKKDGNYRMLDRNAMFLAYQVNPESNKVSGIYIARTPFATNSFNADTDLIVNENNFSHCSLSEQLFLKTSRIDLLPLTREFFPGGMQKNGYINYNIKRAITEAFSHGQKGNKRQESIVEDVTMGGYILPSLVNQYIDNEARWCHQLDWSSIGSGTFERIQEANGVQERERKEKPKKKSKNYHMVHMPRAESKSVEREKISNQARELIESIPKEINPFETTPVRYGLLPSNENLRSEDRLSLKNGGSLRSEFDTGFTMDFPKNIWRGRYIFANIEDPFDLKVSNGDAYRPCAIWNAYKSKESGEICGLEIIPVTRRASDANRFRVYPLSNRSRNASFLLTDYLIRIDLSPQHFHKKIMGDFFEMPPNLVDKMEQGVEKAKMYNDQKVLGMVSIPDDWEKVDMLHNPDIETLKLWSQKYHMKYEGNPVSSSKNNLSYKR